MKSVESAGRGGVAGAEAGAVSVRMIRSGQRYQNDEWGQFIIFKAVSGQVTIKTEDGRSFDVPADVLKKQSQDADEHWSLVSEALDVEVSRFGLGDGEMRFMLQAVEFGRSVAGVLTHSETGMRVCWSSEVNGDHEVLVRAAKMLHREVVGKLEFKPDERCLYLMGSVEDLRQLTAALIIGRFERRGQCVAVITGVAKQPEMPIQFRGEIKDLEVLLSRF